MSFWNKLEAVVRARDSLLCIGLDPDPQQIPSRYRGVAHFCRAIIDATADVAAAYKPNIAFFEALGLPGLQALRQTLDHIPADVPVILDAKRNDIQSTATAYASAAFEYWDADAITVNPYLGRDGVLPFLAYSDRGVFLLCRTSNPSAPEIQDWRQDGRPLFRRVADLAAEWSAGREIGLVIGATYPQDLAAIRSAHPQVWFLVPGIGSQGGELGEALRAGLRPDGTGMILNASRSIIYADDPRAAALHLVAEINQARGRPPAPPSSGGRGDAVPPGQPQRRGQRVAGLCRGLFEAGCVRFGDFLLHSGVHSPVYVDLRRLVTYPRLLAEVAAAYARVLAGLSYDRLCAIPYAALPIGSAISLYSGDALIYPRREAKAYGTRRQIEGDYAPGETVVLLDDVITSGASKLEAIEPLLAEGLVVRDVVVLIDREQGGAADLAARGYHLHAVLTLRQLVGELHSAGLVSAEEAQAVAAYLAGSC